MKKAIGLMVVGLVIFGGISVETYGETGKGFHLGLGAGTFPVWIFNSYYVSAEIGYRFTKRVGILIDAGYSYTSSSYESEESEGYYHYSYTSETAYTSIPISGSLLVTTPVGDNFIAYVGLGAGYYKTKIKEDWTRQSSYSGTKSDTDEVEAKGFAPHISIGMEFSIFDQTTIFAELKHIMGRSESEKTETGYYIKEKIPFGGQVARIGLRIYF